MARKKVKLIEKKEELPSFLLDLKNNSENAEFLLKHKKNAPHIGPIFFGCHQYHPQPHSLDLSSFHHTQYMPSSKENILSGMFLPKTTVEKVSKIRKRFRPVTKPRRKAFIDLYPHQCPGTLKVFKPDAFPFVIDVGETVSIIETEISREIPFPCWIKRASSDSLEAELELVTLSDIWERERKKNVLTYKERMAHTHFPKEFATLRVIGPPIPGAITIAKLPSKRKTDSEIDLHLLSKRKNMEKGESEGKEEEEGKIEMQPGETSEENALSFEEEESLVEEVKSSDKKEEESRKVIEENDFDLGSEENHSEAGEEQIEKKQKSVTFVDEDEEDKENSEEEQEMEPNIQEEGGEENPTEEIPEE